MRTTRILFLDLDGTVRKGFDELGRFVNKKEDVEIFEGVVDIIKSYKAEGWKIVGITNQGGIALGLVTEEDVHAAIKETGIQCAYLFDGIYACSHHPNAKADSKYTKEEKSICICRKPNIGLVVIGADEACKETGGAFYPHACLLVGDREEDRQCAENAHIPFMWAKDWRAAGPLA